MSRIIISQENTNVTSNSSNLIENIVSSEWFGIIVILIVVSLLGFIIIKWILPQVAKYLGYLTRKFVDGFKKEE